MTLADALAAAKAELEGLRAREAGELERSGLRDTAEELTVQNQRLSAQREAARRQLEVLQRELAAAKEHGAELELRIKGAKARVQKLTSAVRR